MFNNFFQKKQKPTEYFAALTISDEAVQAAVFTIVGNKAKAVGKSFQQYEGEWDKLIESADLAISKAAGEINLSEIKKVVFGLPASFIEENKISKDKLTNLKKLTIELELIPSGFVVIPEAINYYLEERDGGPQTTILIGVNRQTITISLFRGGKLTDEINIERTAYISKDIEKGLKEFVEVEIFPSKILLYDGGDLNNVKEELLKYPWQSNNKFLHFPKIEALSSEVCLDATISAAVSELNKIIEEPASETISKQQEIQYKKQIPLKQVAPSQLGFTTDEFSTLREESQQDTISKPRQRQFKLPSLKINVPWLTKDRTQTDVIDTEEEISQDRIPSIRLPKISLQSKWNKLGGLIIIALILLVTGYFLALYKLPKATITLFVDPKVFEQQKDVTINPNISIPSEATFEIPGKSFEVEVSGNKTIPTTGKKIIGDPAKGTITIYNKTGSSRIFEKGTSVSAKNLVFTLDDKVEVPQATESGEGLSYGKANISISAVKIGPEGNLASQTEFTIADFSNSSYSSRNAQALGGGTSREVNTVSAKDQDDLMIQLTQELKTEAKKRLEEKLVSGEKLLDESITGEVISRKFSHEVDQETKELNLSLSMNYHALIYQEKDFSLLLEKMMQQKIPDGYEFKANEASFSILDNLKSEGETIRFKANFTAKLFPKIDTEKIKTEAKGMSVDKFDSYIKTVPNIVGYEITFSSLFSLFQENLPRSNKNITLELKSR